MTDKELKPCPFCGGEAKLVPHTFFSEKTKKFETNCFGVQCKKCQTSGFQFWGCEKHAIEAWNRRAEK